MDKYPPELLHKIFVLVAPGDIKTIRQISRYWNEVVENISGLEVRLNDTKKGNRRFVESVKLKHLIVEHLSTHHFCPKYPHSLLKLTCLRPARLWFLEEALKLQNLTSLQLVDKFFYLQDLPQLFQPGALKNAYLPSLKFLTIEMPVTFQSMIFLVALPTPFKSINGGDKYLLDLFTTISTL
ncbi:unnamed protein product [Allacma fusca]|uniref:F-box domain-containing protein n=1 Tax=Allacma fusca TaxID=39272 RepID=A0A8J2LLB7_9HEXA|nr:unnamed protein product [Allacma fusca]